MGWLGTFLICAIGGMTAWGRQSVTLAWDPSADTNVVGYALYYGPSSGTYPNRVDVGSVTNATVSGLQEGLVYYFVATAYNAASLESTPSNEVTFLVPGILKLTASPTPTNPPRVSFPVAPGRSYILQASQDLKTWQPIWTTTGATNGWVDFVDTQPLRPFYPQRFYRLVSTPSDGGAALVPGIVKLTVGPTPTNPPCVSFTVVPGQSYILQASQDRNTWEPIWTTTGTTNGWVNFIDDQPLRPFYPQRFYRLVLQ